MVAYEVAGHAVKGEFRNRNAADRGFIQGGKDQSIAGLDAELVSAPTVRCMTFESIVQAAGPPLLQA